MNGNSNEIADEENTTMQALNSTNPNLKHHHFEQDEENGDCAKNKLELIAEKYSEKQRICIYKCSICNKKFSSYSTLTTHRISHTGRFKCDVCGKTFLKSANLKEHKIIHTGDRPFKCHTCGKSFSLRSTFHRHQKHVHGISKCACDICADTSGRQFECDLCGMRLYNKGSLRRHCVNVHDMANYKCDVCGKKFTQKAGLTRHVLYYCSANYKCDVCGKKFTQKAGLTRHLLYYCCAESPQCTICGKTFKMSRHLKNSLKRHYKDIHGTSYKENHMDNNKS